LLLNFVEELRFQHIYHKKKLPQIFEAA